MCLPEETLFGVTGGVYCDKLLYMCILFICISNVRTQIRRRTTINPAAIIYTLYIHTFLILYTLYNV